VTKKFQSPFDGGGVFWKALVEGFPKTYNRLGGFYMEGDVIWSLKWTSNILESCDQNIQKIFEQFYEDIFG
jgi:hypothetical protein